MQKETNTGKLRLLDRKDNNKLQFVLQWSLR